MDFNTIIVYNTYNSLIFFFYFEFVLSNSLIIINIHSGVSDNYNLKDYVRKAHKKTTEMKYHEMYSGDNKMLLVIMFAQKLIMH